MYILVILSALSLVLALCIHRFLFGKRCCSKNLPKGSLGLPLIGETLSFLKAFKKNEGEEWINKRVEKYGPIFKTSLMGSPTMVVVGLAANKFSYGAHEDLLAAQQPKTLRDIVGQSSLIALTGQRYKLVKAAMLTFLKSESLENYVKQMDDIITSLLIRETKEKDIINTVTFMKKITYNIACSILFGIKDELTRDAFFDDFGLAMKAAWSMPINFPGTDYWYGMKARSRIIKRALPIINKRKGDLSSGFSTPKSDIISCLLALKAENEETITDELIMDNVISLMFASHDTSAILLSLMVWKMSRDDEVYQKVLQEQVEVLHDREGREEKHLTWADIQKMKYTWRVAQELMRITSLVFASSRKTLQDTTFIGYTIPKGWQVFTITHGTHMNKDIFENPKEFNPSRFENSSKQIPTFGYVAFGAGLHSCIGSEFARVETLTTIHRLVTMYEWKQLHPNETIIRQPMPYPSKGLPIRVKLKLNL